MKLLLGLVVLVFLAVAIAHGGGTSTTPDTGIAPGIAPATETGIATGIAPAGAVPAPHRYDTPPDPTTCVVLDADALGAPLTDALENDGWRPAPGHREAITNCP